MRKLRNQFISFTLSVVLCLSSFTPSGTAVMAKEAGTVEQTVTADESDVASEKTEQPGVADIDFGSVDPASMTDEEFDDFIQAAISTDQEGVVQWLSTMEPKEYRTLLERDTVLTKTVERGKILYNTDNGLGISEDGTLIDAEGNSVDEEDIVAENVEKEEVPYHQALFGLYDYREPGALSKLGASTWKINGNAQFNVAYARNGVVKRTDSFTFSGMNGKEISSSSITGMTVNYTLGTSTWSGFTSTLSEQNKKTFVACTGGDTTHNNNSTCLRVVMNYSSPYAHTLSWTKRVGNHTFDFRASGTAYAIVCCMLNAGVGTSGGQTGAKATMTINHTVPAYTITYNGNGATSGNMSNGVRYADENYTIPVSNYKKDFTITYDTTTPGSSSEINTTTASATLAGFNTSQNAAVSNAAASGSTYNPTSNVILYAIWQNPTITLPTPATKAHYNFKNWTGSNGMTYSAGDSVEVSSGMTFTANWERKKASYTVRHFVQVDPDDSSLSKYQEVTATKASGLNEGTTITYPYSDEAIALANSITGYKVKLPAQQVVTLNEGENTFTYYYELQMSNVDYTVHHLIQTEPGNRDHTTYEEVDTVTGKAQDASTVTLALSETAIAMANAVAANYYCVSPTVKNGVIDSKKANDFYYYYDIDTNYVNYVVKHYIQTEPGNNDHSTYRLVDTVTDSKDYTKGQITLPYSDAAIEAAGEEIEDYYCVKPEKQVVTLVKGGENTFNYYYDIDTDYVNYTVKHYVQSEPGNRSHDSYTLADTVTAKAKKNTVVTLDYSNTAIEAAGNVAEDFFCVSPEKQTVSIQKGEQNEYAYYYDIDTTTVHYTVNHYVQSNPNSKDHSTYTLAESVSAKGERGSVIQLPYSETAIEAAGKVADGYFCVSPEKQTVTLIMGGYNVFNYYYDIDTTQAFYTIHHMVQTDPEITDQEQFTEADTVSGNGVAGEPMELPFSDTAKELANSVDGYECVLPEVTTKILKKGNQNDFYLYYTLREKPITNADYTVHHMVQTDPEITDQEQFTEADTVSGNGLIGSAFSIDLSEKAIALANSVDGYECVKPAVKTVSLQAGENEFYYYYKLQKKGENDNTGATYIVHHMVQTDPAVTDLSQFTEVDTVSGNGVAGSSFSLDLSDKAVAAANDVDGYECVKPEIKTVSLQTGENEFYYYYKLQKKTTSGKDGDNGKDGEDGEDGEKGKTDPSGNITNNYSNSYGWSIEDARKFIENMDNIGKTGSATFTINGVKYTITQNPDGTYSITFMQTNNGGTLTVPSYIKVGDKVYPTTVIAANAFKGNTTIKTVVISDGITIIGDYAFYGCTALETVSMANTVLKVGKYAFAKCPKLKKVIASASCYEMGKGVFSDDGALTSIKLGNKLTKIPVQAFKNCKKLKSIKITKSVTEIGKQAFYGCKKLKTVTFKTTLLKKVGSKAFKKCKKGIKFKVPKKKKESYKKLLKGKY